MENRYIIKRNGDRVLYDKEKIFNAIYAAYEEVYPDNKYAKIDCTELTNNIDDYIDEDYSVEDIQDIIEHALMEEYPWVARAYIRYRHNRENSRAISGNLKDRYNKLIKLVKGEDEDSKKENSNKDTRILSTMRDYIAGFTCKEIASGILLPKSIKEAHERGEIHFHDSDYSPAMPMTNCCLINLEDMLQNGTVISGTKIDRPTDFRTACTITTQIAAQVASSQYGGQTINVAHLAPFIQLSRERYKRKFPSLSTEQISELVNDEIADGIQTIQYQFITMSSTNGQAPFVSLFMWINDAKNEQEKADLALIIQEILKQRIAGIKNEHGVPITTAFPKLLYVLDDNNITEDSEYWYLTELAAECSSKRLVPDYISAKVMKKLKGDVYGCMGCRSFLSGDPVNHKYWGKFNKGVVTINLAYAALKAINSDKDYFEVLDETLEKCHDALLIRYNSLVGTKSDVAPILWQHGAIARLKQGEVIDSLLGGDYSSISLGYSGLWETVLAVTGKTFFQEEGMEYAKKVMQHLNDKCDEWNRECNLGFSLYGTPMENTTEKFARALKDFPIIKGINDKLYLVNSYHVDPAYEVNAFEKLSIEGQLSPYSGGGQISYIETPTMTGNIPALLEVIKHIYETNMYAEINTMTSYCHVCGCTDIKMEDDLKFHCPQCGNDDFDKMNVAVRVCGYISTNPFVEGRAADIHARVKHIGEE